MINVQPGPDQFKDWIERRWPNSDRKAREAAAYFGWDEAFISKLSSGVRKPGLTNAIIIERKTGIPTEAWVSSELDESNAETPTNGRKRR